MSVSRIHRLLKVITLMRSQRAPTARELADELEVSRRTLFRDLNMLELAGVPYYHDPQAGGYRISQSYFLPPVNLTLDEALALMTLVGQGGALPLHELTSEAAAKIESVLPRAIQGELAKSAGHIEVSWPSQARHSTVQERFEQVRSAIAGNRRLKMTYVSFFERGQIVTELSPYRLFYYQRAWYVIGRSSQHSEVRTFKLGRIKKLEQNGKLFVADEKQKFDLRQYFGNAWGMIPEGREHAVRLRFSPRVGANVAEVNWHPTQKTQFESDGSVVFEATVDGLGEISWWILGYGDQVEVLSPRALRTRVYQMARAMADRHAPSPDGSKGA